MSLVPNEAPRGLTAEDYGATHSIAVKWRLLPLSNDYGILSGYRLRYQLSKIGEVITTDQSVKQLIIDSKTSQVLLNNLKMYGTYSIWLSAFTIKGNGPESFTYGGKQRRSVALIMGSSDIKQAERTFTFPLGGKEQLFFLQKYLYILYKHFSLVTQQIYIAPPLPPILACCCCHWCSVLTTATMTMKTSQRKSLSMSSAC